jgi:hypothetical protein
MLSAAATMNGTEMRVRAVVCTHAMVYCRGRSLRCTILKMRFKWCLLMVCFMADARAVMPNGVRPI